MGRQTQFHMLGDDCTEFLKFVQQHDPVVVLLRDWEAPDVEAVRDPCRQGGTYCLWNQDLLPRIKRKHVVVSKPYYRIDTSLPLIEFFYPQSSPEEWNGRPSLTQGRIWAAFETEDARFAAWYNAIVRWIRKNFTKNPLPLAGYVGPAAYDWFKKGGILLPILRPPITASWLSWVEAQDQDRALFVK